MRRGLFALSRVVFSNRFYIWLRYHTVSTTVYCIGRYGGPFQRMRRSAALLPPQRFRRFHAAFALCRCIHHIWYLPHPGDTISMLFYQNVTIISSIYSNIILWLC